MVQRQAQRTRKAGLPVLLRHSESFSTLCNILRKLDSTEKHDN